MLSRECTKSSVDLSEKNKQSQSWMWIKIALLCAILQKIGKVDRKLVYYFI